MSSSPQAGTQLRARRTAHGPLLCVIVAMARNRVIGAKGGLPWHLPDELKLFRKLTLGHHIIMGRRTWDSIARLLPGRRTVIVSRDPGLRVAGALVAPSLPAAVAACADDPEVFVIGGAALFREALPIADRLYLTVVDAAPAGDTWMPDLDLTQWREVASSVHPADEHHAWSYRHTMYER